MGNSTYMIQILILTILFCYSSAIDPTFNVQTYGAKSDGISDCTNAFSSAWSAACAAMAPATIYVPPGRYMLRNARFSGVSCKNTAITIRIDGTLVAPSDHNAHVGKSGSWVMFERVTGVSIYGGTLDAQATNLYACKKSGKRCPRGETSLGLYNSNNIMIKGLTSLNSELFHIMIHGCNNVNLFNTTISAPGSSPNTDGIHVARSSGVSIISSVICTGDDCISIGPGTSNLFIQNLACGPGHGVSIGSLGWTLNEEGVQNVTLDSANFTRTQNGVRVKTWARPSNGFVKGVIFKNITMVDVKNPIIIDQNYCPHHQKCPNQSSGVKISDVRYEDIWGTSATKVAVKLDCSKTEPCTEITAVKVDLTYQDKPAAASCANAVEKLADREKPTPSLC